MFRKMRRSRQELSREESIKVLERGTHGVLALMGDDGYPYALPISYAYKDGRIYFHSAVEGHKIDSIRRCGKASFTVVDLDEVKPEEYTTVYRSVIAFGRIRLLDDPEEKLRGIRIIGDRYVPENAASGHCEEIGKYGDGFAVIELDVEHLSGKASLRLIG